MKHRYAAMITVALVVVLGWTTNTVAQDFNVELEGFQEVPAVSTSGSGMLSLSNTAPHSYVLDYAALEGEIMHAHIHLAQRGSNGGIMVWLCGNPNIISPPPGTPICEGTVGTVIGELTPARIIGPSGQGIDSGDLIEALDAMRGGVAYVNVHTTKFAGGEIRGQLTFNSAGESIEDLREDLDNLQDDFNDLEDDFGGHTHTYLTGRGNGHNNTEADSGPPEF